MNFQAPDSPPPFDLTGRTLGDYQILRRLGRGGMADVYLAKQISLNRNIALKILKPELAKDESYVKRFRQEAQAAAALRQANIVQIHEVGELQGYYFISQEYVQGRNLSQYIGRHGAVEPVMAINVLRQCAMALQESGKQNVIHRDIKPENIMLSTNGEVKITDFGLARVNDDAAKQALTQVGVTMGTPLYMSPEQVEGASVDQRSDIYSLGVTAYHMLAGSPPFEGENALSIAVQHVKDEAIPLNNLRPDVPEELCEIIKTMMAKKPADRPIDAKQLLKELRKVKIDFDDDWEMIVEKLSASDSISSNPSGSWSQSKLAATRQLQTVMKGNLRSWWKSSLVLLSLLGLSLGGLLGGVFLAKQLAPPPLLAAAESFEESQAVKKLDSSTEQLNEAEIWPAILNKDPEPYYQAVIEYWNPEDEPNEVESEITKAKNRIAMKWLSIRYLEQNRDREAMPIFEKFIKLDDLNAEFRAIGELGQAIVFDRQDASEFEGGEDERLRRIGEAIKSFQRPEKRKLLNGFEYYETQYDQLFKRLNQTAEPTTPTE